MPRWLFPILAVALSLVFSALVGKQYLERRKPHQLLWAISFLLFAFATFAEFYSEVRGWNPILYKLYYPSTAILVGVMGAGTMYLLANRQMAHTFLGLLILTSLVMIWESLSADLIMEAFVPGQTVAGEAMPDSVRAFSPILTISGSLALLIGAVYSWAKTGTFFNVLIALGTLILGASGSAARFGQPEILYFGETLGLTVLFIGFLKSREVVAARDRKRAIRARR